MIGLAMPALWRRAHAGIRCGPLCNHIFGYTCAVILGIYTGMLAAQFILVLLCVVPCLVLAAGMKISLLITHKAVLAREANLPDKKEVRPAKTQETMHERKRVKKAERQELKKLRRSETRARRMWLTIRHQIYAEHGWFVAALCHPRCFECFCSGIRSFAYIVTAWVSLWSLVRLHNAHALTAAAVAFLAAGSGLFLLRRYPSRCAAILRIRWLEGLASPWLSYVRRKYDEASSKQAARAGAARKILSLKLQVRKPCCLDIRRREEERRWRDLMEPWRKRMRERSTRRAAAKLRRAGWMVRQMVYAKCATESFQKRGVQSPGQPSEMEPLISDKDGVPQGADPLVMEMACDPCPSSDRWFAHLAYLCSAEACAKGSGKGADAMRRPLREGIRVNGDQNARPRGGGVDEDIYGAAESFQKRGIQGPGQPSETVPLISDKDGVPQGADPIVMEMACDPCPSSDRWFAHLAYLCSAEACAKGSGKGADAMRRPLREGIRVNRDQNARPRGGGVDEDIYDVGESRASNPALLQGHRSPRRTTRRELP